MRIIHTADLHLGRSLHERDLLPDQEAMLASLLALLASREADLLLIAGDIYDRAIPQPEAIALFDSFLSSALAARPGLVIAAIPGNHDSASRLSFGAGLLSRAGLHIRVRPQDCAEPIRIEKGGEALCLWALPYLNPGAFAVPGMEPGQDGAVAQPPAAQGELFGPGGEAAPGLPAGPAGQGLRSQAELFSEAMRRIKPRLDPGSYNVLLAHCFAAGSSPSESERSFVGAAEEVSVSLFEGFDYVALGHLHRHQGAGPVARYPGSPLAYSFSEAEAQPDKGFLLVELGPGGRTEEFLPLVPLHRVVRISGSFSELSAPGAFPGHGQDYVEIRLTDSLPVLDPIDALKLNFPNLLSLRQAAFELEAPGPQAGAADGHGRRAEGLPSVLEDFRAFHREMLREDPDPATEALFAELLAEAQHETA